MLRTFEQFFAEMAGNNKYTDINSIFSDEPTPAQLKLGEKMGPEVAKRKIAQKLKAGARSVGMTMLGHKGQIMVAKARQLLSPDELRQATQSGILRQGSDGFFQFFDPEFKASTDNNPFGKDY